MPSMPTVIPRLRQQDSFASIPSLIEQPRILQATAPIVKDED
jgi:hypothetical protein